MKVHLYTANDVSHQIYLHLDPRDPPRGAGQYFTSGPCSHRLVDVRAADEGPGSCKGQAAPSTDDLLEVAWDIVS